MNRFTNFIKTKAKSLVAVGSAALSCGALAIAAGAEDVTSGGTGMSTAISTAADTITAEFTNMVSTLIPVLVGVAMVGLGMFAVYYMFGMCKKFFAKASK